MGTQPLGPIKWHGGKHYLAPRIVALMPSHTHYVELFGGGLAVLFAKPPVGTSEVVNDLNGDLVNFFAVLRNKKRFERFRRRVACVPFGRAVWEDAARRLRTEPDASSVLRAQWFFTANRMSLAGRMDNFTAITKTRVRRHMNAEVAAWLGAVDGLPAVHARLQRVVIENRPATQLMPAHDVDGALFYADPPYPAETRSSPGTYGEYEMSTAAHRKFLTAATSLKSAKILISGYRNAMYDESLRGWNRHEFDMPNHAAAGKSKGRRLEVVWANF